MARQMRHRTCALSWILASLCGCSTGGAVRAFRVHHQDRPLFDLTVAGEDVNLGAIGFVAGRTRLMGLGRIGRWRLEREGDRWTGIVEGKPAEIALERGAGRTIFSGHVGTVSVRVVSTSASLQIQILDTDLLLRPEPHARGGGGGRVLATADGRYRVQLTNINSVRTRGRYELLLLLCSFELFYHDQLIRSKLRPGYEGAPPDFFQSGGSLRPPGS